MKEPTRLSETSAVARVLLQSARRDAAPAASRRRALSMTAAAASAASATKALSAAAAVTKGVLPWVASVLFGAAVAVGVVSARRVAHDESAPQPVTSSVVPRTTAPVVLREAPAVEGAPQQADRDDDVAPRSQSSPSGLRPASPAAPPQAAADPSSELSRELRLLDAASRALAAGDLTAASADLDRYTRDFPHGTLTEEALAIRIRVWARSGNRDRAQALYEQLARTYPASPYLDSLRDAVASSRP
jgi:TolA-binding protein